MPPENITLRSNERLFLCGQTGSGKTYAAKSITRPLSRLIVLDPKGDLEDWDLAPWDREAKRLLRVGEPIRTRVIPKIGEDAAPVWEEALTAALNAGNCTVYIDEIYGVVDPGGRPPPMLNAVWTRGRGLGVGGWGASQRPVWVPLIFLSEAQHFFAFRLLLDEDRRRMGAFMGPHVMEPILDEHGFYYMAASGREPVYFETLPNGKGPQPRQGPAAGTREARAGEKGG